MKRFAVLLLAFLMLFSLCSCGGGDEESKPGDSTVDSNPLDGVGTSDVGESGEVPSEPVSSSESGEEVKKEAKILEVWENDKAKSALLYFTDGSEPLNCNLPEGCPAAAGDTVDLVYNGYVLETYPGIISASEMTVKQEGRNYYGACMEILENLFEEDPGLNDGALTFGFDISCDCLNSAETDILTSLFCNSKGTSPVFGTYDELVEQGYIDGEKLYWEDGVLFKLEEQETNGDKITFRCEKWRGGLGAVMYNAIEVEFDGDAFSIDMGPMAMA